MIIIPDSKTDLFICTYDVNLENNTYKTKVINSKNEEKFTEYEQVEAIENIDSDNNSWYEEKVLRFKKDGKYGLIDYEGKTILDPEYDDIYALNGVENSIIIKKDEKLGLCNNSGSIIIEVKYNEILPIGTDNKNGYIVKNEQNKYGVVDTSKKIVVDFLFDEISSVSKNGLYVVKSDGKNKIVDDEKSSLLEDKFDEVCEVIDDRVIYKKDGKYGVIKISGEEVVAPKYEYLTGAFSNYYIAKKDGKFGVINNSNEEKVEFNYSLIEYIKDADFLQLYSGEEIYAKILDSNFEEKMKAIVSDINNETGYMRVRLESGEYKYYNYKFEEQESSAVLPNNNILLSKKDEKYGYVDKNGKIVVDYIYEDATELNQFGYASVKKDGKWGAIDKKGNSVCECKYELKDNIIIDFIGSWHIGADVNSIFYTDI